jgi:hemerythrin-like metal-binding protein
LPYQSDESHWSLEWTQDLSVNNPEIDGEHQHFILLVNELNNAIASRLDLAYIQKCMLLIIEDAELHFAHEEYFFKEWGYPGADEHANIHAQIMIALHKIMAGFKRGGLYIEWIESGLTIKKTLINHILNSDMKYRDFCNLNVVDSKSVAQA